MAENHNSSQNIASVQNVQKDHTYFPICEFSDSIINVNASPFEFGVSRSKVKDTVTFKLRGHTCSQTFLVKSEFSTTVLQLVVYRKKKLYINTFLSLRLQILMSPPDTVGS